MNTNDFKVMVKNAIYDLEAQGETCVDEEGVCCYTNDGKACIVGMMMPESVRVEAEGVFNGGSISDLWVKGMGWTNQFSVEQIGILQILQAKHDRTYENFKDKIQDMEKILCEI